MTDSQQDVNRQFLLAARPQGMVKESDFEYRETPVPEIGPDQVLIRTTRISLDPSMRGQMENRADYVAGVNARMATWREEVAPRLTSEEVPVNMARMVNELNLAMTLKKWFDHLRSTVYIS